MKTVNFVKRAFLLSFLLLFVFSSSLPLVSCTEESKPQVNNRIEESEPQVNNRIFYDYFDTVCVIYDYSGMESERFSSLAKSVEAAIAHYHRLFDIYHEYEGMTNLATLNRLAGAGAVQVPGEIIELLSFSLEMYGLTGGKVNIAMGSVLSLWHDFRLSGGKGGVPSAEELSKRGEHTSVDSVVIDRENSTVEITDPELSLDVGAIAKGYTAELIKTELKAEGYSGIVLDMGGNLCAVGSKPGGGGWKSAIRNPLYFEGAEEPYTRTVTIIDESLVTSGVYERYFIFEGVRYHHIIDPETLIPESRYLSVSVKTSHSGAADALSTAIFNMSEEEAEVFVASLEDTEVTLIFSDGSHRVLKSGLRGG